MSEAIVVKKPRYTPEPIEQIVATYKTGISMREVAERYNCSMSTVSRFVRERNYDRTHVGGKVTKFIPPTDIMAKKNAEEQPEHNPFRVMARTLKLHSDTTGHSYTVSTEAEVVDIESENALMQLPVGSIDAFIEELTQIKAMLGNPL